MKTLCRRVAVVLPMLFCAIARAELKWDQTTVEAQTGPNDQVVVAHFKYQNPGKTPVRFKEVKPACGCTTVQTQQEEVPPGEKGEITAQMRLGERAGVQEKTIRVETDDPVNPVTVLTIKAVIPQPIEVVPTFLFWQSGEQPKPKTITVKAAKDWPFPLRGLNVSISNWAFKTDLEKINNNEFRIHVEPRDATHAAMATLTIQPEDSSRKFVANLRVMGKSSESPGEEQPPNAPVDILKNPFGDEPKTSGAPGH